MSTLSPRGDAGDSGEGRSKTLPEVGLHELTMWPKLGLKADQRRLANRTIEWNRGLAGRAEAVPRTLVKAVPLVSTWFHAIFTQCFF